MAIIIKPPTVVPSKTLFLAGSIEMGAAINWQADVEKDLADVPVTILNPRRDNWDASWEQSTRNPQFVGQVSWELEGLEKADYVLFYFDPKTKSPVTLLELGLAISAKDPIGHIWVVCPDGYWRKGNVDIVCNRYYVPRCQTLEQAIWNIRTRLL